MKSDIKKFLLLQIDKDFKHLSDIDKQSIIKIVEEFYDWGYREAESDRNAHEVMFADW